jgi:putative flippase GtrA
MCAPSSCARLKALAPHLLLSQRMQTTLNPTPRAVAQNADTASLLARAMQAFATWLRASFAGGAATACDLAVLLALTEGFGISPRHANVPALIVGGVVNFFANRHFAFRAAAAPAGKQAIGYVVVESAALLLNALVYDSVIRFVPLASTHYAVVRVAAGAVVFLLWSYPLWRIVFRTPAGSARAIPDGRYAMRSRLDQAEPIDPGADLQQLQQAGHRRQKNEVIRAGARAHPNDLIR